jgi:hypothetical protein
LGGLCGAAGLFIVVATLAAHFLGQDTSYSLPTSAKKTPDRAPN